MSGCTYHELKTQTKLIRKPRYNRSKLDKHSDAIISLHKKGASAAEIHRYLKAKRVAVSYSAVQRWIKKHA